MRRVGIALASAAAQQAISHGPSGYCDAGIAHTNTLAAGKIVGGAHRRCRTGNPIDALVSANRLKQTTLAQLQAVTVSNCRGVDSKLVDIRGELYRNIEIGGMLVKQHRFLVVEGLVVPLILGSDFLARLGEVTFDFPQSKLFIRSLPRALITPAGSLYIYTGVSC